MDLAADDVAVDNATGNVYDHDVFGGGERLPIVGNIE